MAAQDAHLPSWMRDSADYLLQWGEVPDAGATFLVHSAVLAMHSHHLANLFQMAASPLPDGRGLPVLVFVQASLPPQVASSSKHITLFLEHLYHGAAAPLSNLDDVQSLLALADYFGVAPITITARCEAWLAHEARRHLAEPTPAGAGTLVAAFELAAHYRLTNAASLLLPWVAQRLNAGPAGDPVWQVWREAQGWMEKLQAAADGPLRAACMQAHWWARGMPSTCPACPCRSGDIAFCCSHFRAVAAPWWIAATHASELPPRDQYLAAAHHFAHLLAAAEWGRTPAHGLV
jgi:hypothetical protein